MEQIRRQYMDAGAIMARYNVSRATAYRYLGKISEGEKAAVQYRNGHTIVMALHTAVRRVHAAAVPGNPHLNGDHQQKAAQSRWTALQKNTP